MVGEAPGDDRRRVGAQLAQVLARERRRGADDVAPEPERGRPLERQAVGADGVLEVDPAVQELVGLEVRVLVGGAHLVAIVGLREEPRGPQDQAGQPVVAVDELAEPLGRRLGHAVDVARDRYDVFSDPRRGRAFARRQRPAERARGAREDEPPDAGLDGLLEQVERPGHVGVDELLAAVRADVRLVQRRGVQDRVDALQAAAHERAVGDRSDLGRERAVEDVEPHHVAPVGAQHAHQRLAEMPRAAGHQDPHALRDISPRARARPPSGATWSAGSPAPRGRSARAARSRRRGSRAPRRSPGRCRRRTPAARRRSRR